MRGDVGQRGEAARVAARVRALLDAHSDAGSDLEWLRRASTGDEPAADQAPNDDRGRLPDERPVTDAHLGAQDGPSGLDRAAQPPAPGMLARLRARVPVRVDPGRRAVIAVGLAVLVAAVATGAWLLAHRPSALAVAPSVPGTSPVGTGVPPTGVTPGAAPSSSPAPGSATASGGAASASVQVVVDVAGRVRRPGLYRLPSGSRIDDAVQAAGGALSGVNLSSLNLAAKVVDGQQVLVGVPGAAGAPAAGPTAGSGGAAAPGTPGGPGAPVDLNSAGLEQLESLPGIGPVLAQHILDWRTAHGSFTSVDQLDDVTGIGPAKFASLKPLVTV